MYLRVVSLYSSAPCVGSVRSPLKVFEVGCGTGNNLWFFATEGHGIHGLDVSPSKIALAQQRLESLGFHPELSVSDLADLPHSISTFELTLDRGCLTCVVGSQLPRTIAELHRVLLTLSRTYSAERRPHGPGFVSPSAMKPRGSAQELERRRRRDVQAVHDGDEVADVARIFGVSERAVRGWLAARRDGGIKASQPDRIPAPSLA